MGKEEKEQFLSKILNETVSNINVDKNELVKNENEILELSLQNKNKDFKILFNKIKLKEPH